MANINLPEELKIEIRNKVKSKAKELAKKARDEIKNEYLYVFQRFYEEYEPEYYYRHMDYHQMNNLNDVRKSGMGRTFELIKIDKGRDLYKGGIYISTKNMHDNYRGTQEQVLYSFLSGYHGLPLNDPYAIYGSTRVYDHMMKFRDYLEDYIKEEFTIDLNFK